MHCLAAGIDAGSYAHFNSKSKINPVRMTISGTYPGDKGLLSADELSDIIEHLSTEYLSQPENLVKVKTALREYERCRRLLEQQQKDFATMILDVEEKSRLLEEEAATMRERCTQAEQELLELKADAAHNSDQLQQELQMYKSIAEMNTSTSNSALSTRSPYRPLWWLLPLTHSVFKSSLTTSPLLDVSWMSFHNEPSRPSVEHILLLPDSRK